MKNRTWSRMRQFLRTSMVKSLHSHSVTSQFKPSRSRESVTKTVTHITLHSDSCLMTRLSGPLSSNYWRSSQRWHLAAMNQDKAISGGCEKPFAGGPHPENRWGQHLNPIPRLISHQIKCTARPSYRWKENKSVCGSSLSIFKTTTVPPVSTSSSSLLISTLLVALFFHVSSPGGHIARQKCTIRPSPWLCVHATTDTALCTRS